MWIASLTAATLRGGAIPICASRIPEPMPSTARPSESSSSAAISIAINVGCRLNGLKTPAPSRIVRVASALAARAAIAPRANGFSANHTVVKPASSAARACAAQSLAASPP